MKLPWRLDAICWCDMARNGRPRFAGGKSLPDGTHSRLPLGLIFIFQEEISMTLPIASMSAGSALPSLSVHSHGHGHKKGLESATDSTGDTDAPTGSTQSLFSNLLTSMEQVVGTQPANAATQTAGSAQPVSMNKTAGQTAAAPSSAAAAANAVLGTIGSALHFFA
jgi:hypothetical protein